MPTTKICIHCKKEFSIYYEVNGVKKHSDKRKFCYECSPIGSHNTKPSFDGSIQKKSRINHSITEKICDVCGKTKKIEDFYKSHKSCKTCHNAEVLEKQRNLKKQCTCYLGSKCTICGYDKCQGALEFHHRNPLEKDFGLSHKKRCDFESLKKELDKCILVCANCHREIHSDIKTHL